MKDESNIMQLYWNYRQRLLFSCEEITRRLGIFKYWQFVQKHNLSNGLAYHNLTHLAYMVHKTNLFATDCKLSRERQRRLALAAMFHDYNHTGGTYLDSDNIERAIDGYIGCCHAQSRAIPHDEIESVSRLIAITEYPFVHAPTTLEEKFIRDCDILYGCNVDLFEKIIYNDLYSELLVAKPDMDFFTYVKGQKQFLTSVEMFTHTGRHSVDNFIYLHAVPYWESHGVK